MRRAALRGLIGKDGGAELRADLYEVRRTLLLSALEQEDLGQVHLARVHTLAGTMTSTDEKVRAYTEFSKTLFPHWIFDAPAEAPQVSRESFVEKYKRLLAAGEVT